MFPDSVHRKKCLLRRTTYYDHADAGFYHARQKVILTRRLLLMEQFRNERARHFATLHFLSGTKEIYTKIFAEMMDNDLLKKDDPEMLAFAYTAPITSLIHLCDREPEKESEILQQVEAFVKHFIRIYKKG